MDEREKAILKLSHLYCAVAGQKAPKGTGLVAQMALPDSRGLLAQRFIARILLDRFEATERMMNATLQGVGDIAHQAERFCVTARNADDIAFWSDFIDEIREQEAEAAASLAQNRVRRSEVMQACKILGVIPQFA